MTIKNFECKNCGASVTVRAIGRSVSAICESCHSVIDLTDENYQIIAKANAQIKVEPLLELGSRGFLQGHEWEIIGFMQREDLQYAYCWQEYLLFNPRYGYRWLTEAEGHWNFVIMLKEKPQIGSEFTGVRSIAKIAEHKYYLYSQGMAKVNFVLGEFYWRIQTTDKASLSDYIDPPYMLSRETTVGEENWSLGEYIEPIEIEKAFDLQYKLPSKAGISANQPSIYAAKGKTVKNLLILFLGLAFALQVFQTIIANGRVVYQNSFTSQSKNIITPPIELKGGLKNLELLVTAPNLSNNWLGIEGELVNEKTAEVYAFEKSIEYYSGFEPGEDGGYWSEGNKKGANLLTNIPDGLYHLNVNLESSNSAVENFELTLKRGVPTWGNFWFALLLLIIPYILYFIFEYNFEVKRWSESDFSPYTGGEDDE